MMGIRSFLLKRLFTTSFLKRIIDNIFMFSDLTVDLYLQSPDYDRRQFFIKKSLSSVGIGYRIGPPLKAEKWFIETVLSDLFSDRNVLVLFDVGANVGEYSSYLNLCFPNSRIFSFEPNPVTFQILETNFLHFENIETINIALSNTGGSIPLYSYKQNQTSGHASLERKVFSELYHQDDLVEFQVLSLTLEEFTTKKDINHIDFIKIDTEGYELEVLSGGHRLLAEKSISLIQFEFNEMNIVKRIFLKDFFDLLLDYEIFRLSDGELVNISNYRSDFEIFWYQDIIAVLKSNESMLKKLSKYQIKTK